MAALHQFGIIVVVVVIAALFQLEVDNEPLIVEKSVVLQGTDVDVFRFIADLPNYSKWINFITQVDELDASRIGVGKSFEIHMQFPFVGAHPYRTDITNYGPPKSLAFDTNFELLLPRTVLEITDDSRPGVSKLIWRMYSKRRSYLFCVKSEWTSFIEDALQAECNTDDSQSTTVHIPKWGTVLPISRFIISKQLQGALFRLKLHLSHQ